MKVALLGSEPCSTNLAPFADKSYSKFAQAKQPAYPPAKFIHDDWQIWGCSPAAFASAVRADRWFEVHRWEPGQIWFSPEYCQFLRECPVPVYTGGVIPEIKNHVVYPIAEVEAEFSSFFLNSSLSLMAAVAILDIERIRSLRKLRTAEPDNWGNNEIYSRLRQTMSAEIIAAEVEKDDSDDVIGLWGVDMAANEEYSRQKPGCWFFMLEIVRRGIGLYYPPESDLGCPEPVYGLCEWDHAYIKATARARQINGRIQANQATLSQLQAQMMADEGAKLDMNYNIKTWMAPYRMPAGVILRQTPGTGLGGHIVHADGKPAG